MTGFSYNGFPVTRDAFQSSYKGGQYGTPNAIVAELSADGSALLYGSYLGGSGDEIGEFGTVVGDTGSSIALDSSNNVYVAGIACSLDFPVSNGAFQTQNKDLAGAVFLTKFAFNGGTTTSLTSDVASQNVGELVTYTAHVKPVSSGAAAQGNVTFIIDGAIASEVALIEGGYAIYYSSSLSAGSHSIVASYEGQPGTYSASSGTLTETILNQVATPFFPRTAGTYASPVPVQIQSATAGAAIHYTTDGTTPTASSPVYSGPVTVSAPTTTVKAIALSAGSMASTVGTAVYTIIPKAIPTTIAVKSLSNPSTFGQSPTFVTTVTPASGPAATGTVYFKNGGIIVGSAPLVNGVATFSIPNLTLLGHSIAATYSGSSTNESSSATITQEVQP